MSTTTFAKMEAKSLPTQAVAGKVISVGPFTPSKGSGGVYITGPVEVAAFDAGKGEKIYFTFRPEWFTHEFHEAVNEVSGVEAYFQRENGEDTYQKTNGETKNAAKSFAFVYQSNIANGDNNSFLQCMFPDEELFEKFVAAAFAQEIDAAEPDLDKLNEFLREQFDGKLIGYILKQVQIKTEKVNEQGKAVYIKDNKRAISSYFPVTEAKCKQLIKSAEKSKAGFQVTFNLDSIF
jgi:hypothetical protein